MLQTKIGMFPSDVTALRGALALNPLQLAERLGVTARLVLQWESGDRFPTKRHCQMMAELVRAEAAPAPRDGVRAIALAQGPAPVKRIVEGLLDDPEFERRLCALVTDYLESSSGKSGSGGSSHSGSDAPKSLAAAPESSPSEDAEASASSSSAS